MQPEQQDRREWIVRTLATLGFFTADPLSAPAQHSHSSATQTPPAANWKPAVLSSDQNRSLMVLSDAIIPGATAAGCNRAIDLLLTIESAAAREKVLSSIQAFQKESEATLHKPLEQLSASDLATLLQNSSASGSSLASPFKTLKQWTSDVYWSSQQGMRDLGFKGRVAWATFPGCTHGGAHT